MNKNKGLKILCLILLSLSITQAAIAIDYTLDDPGFITDTQIHLDTEWYSRPGLVDFPPPALTYGPYPVQAQLAEESPITSVLLYHGPPGVEHVYENTSITGGLVEGDIDPTNFGFDYCQPVWDYSFYLIGYDVDGGFVEHDERHYADGTGGDPYIFQIQNQNPNQQPVADPNGPYEVDRWDSITLDGSGSSDPEGASLTYQWDIYADWQDYEESPYAWDDLFDDGVGVNPEVSFDENGLYHIRLKVIDECGEEQVAETTVMVYDPHMVVIPQNDTITGLNWRPGLNLTLEIDGYVYDTVPVEFFSEADGYGYFFDMQDYDVDVVPGMDVVLCGDYDTVVKCDEIIRPHTVRYLTITHVDPGSDTVFGFAFPGTYVRVRIDDPYWVEIVALADLAGEWLADFSIPPGVADITPETQIVAIQQNDFDSSHTLVLWHEEEEQIPFFTIQPEHRWAHGNHWPIGVLITLTIDDDDDPNNGIIYEATEVSVPAEWDPEVGEVSFDLWEVDELARGLYVTMTDGVTTKDTWIADLYYDQLDIGADIAHGRGPADAIGGFMIQTEDSVFAMEIVVMPSSDWTADFGAQGFNATEVLDTFIKVRDEDGDETMIHLPPPRFVEGSITPVPAELNAPVSVNATFESFLINGPDDPLLDLFFCYLGPLCWEDVSNWHPAMPLTNVSAFVSGEFQKAFSEPGIYPTFVRATYPNGPEEYEFLGYIVVHDPSIGFVTGGGWFNSPEGAFRPDPTLKGKASFGFVAKYIKNANVPSGNTEFQFHSGDLNFHSNNYDWLVVTGRDYAMFKGVGTINSIGEYRFMVWAGDNDPDTFRIKIWEEDEYGVETVIYDNGFDQAISGGNILIHTKK